jgi:hypothetical protein
MEVMLETETFLTHVVIVMQGKFDPSAFQSCKDILSNASTSFAEQVYDDL